MLEIVPNRRIDKQRWDALVESSPVELIYGRSWFLDAVAPGWRIIVDDDYSAGIPIAHAVKFGQPYIYQPLFAQRFALYQKRNADPKSKEKILNSIPASYRFVDLHFDLQGVRVPGRFEAELRTTQILPLNKSLVQLRKRYHSGLRYSIRKSQRAGISIRKNISLLEFTEFLKQSKLYRDQSIYATNHNALMRLMKSGDEQASGKMWGAFLPGGELVSIAYTVEDHSRVYYLFQCSSAKGRTVCAAHAMTDSMIEHYARSAKLLDFVGSNIPSVAFFNNQFGARSVFYQRITGGSRAVSHCLWQTVKSAVF